MGEGFGKIGFIDADIHGPCVPKMLYLKGSKLELGPRLFLVLLAQAY